MIPLELPTGDIATLLARMPFRSQHGAMRLSLDGLRFVERSGAELLHVGPDQIVDVESHGNADLWSRTGAIRRARVRVRWSRVTDRTPLQSPLLS